jgi:hypothetical protein
MDIRSFDAASAEQIERAEPSDRLTSRTPKEAVRRT